MTTLEEMQGIVAVCEETFAPGYGVMMSNEFGKGFRVDTLINGKVENKGMNMSQEGAKKVYGDFHLKIYSFINKS